MLCCLQQFGLRVKLSKCQFFQDSVTYLGHKITCDGIQLKEERIRAVKETPIPQNKTELEVIFRHDDLQRKIFVMSRLAPPLPTGEEGYQVGMV